MTGTPAAPDRPCGPAGRAIGIGAIALAHHVNDTEPDDAAYDLAEIVVCALIAHPHVLHDLIATTGRQR